MINGHWFFISKDTVLGLAKLGLITGEKQTVNFINNGHPF